MSDEILQIDYDQMELIAEQFQTQSDIVEQMLQSLNQPFSELQSGGWVGEGADAFFLEYETELQPVIQRLLHALQSGSEATQRIIDVLSQAEEEAANQFTFEGDGGGADGGGPSGAGEEGTTTKGEATPGGNANGSVINPDGTVNTDLVDERAAEIYRKEGGTYPYMDEFAQMDENGNRYEVPVTDEAALNRQMEDLMYNLENDPNYQPPDSVFDEIAELRGVDSADIKQDYEEFKALLAHANNSHDYAPLDTNRHPDFLGGTASLRYGKVTGDMLGIDPIFGALLNPTGGLVGPASDSFEPGDNSAIGYHGIFHDAAGYTFNHFDGKGPGYEYLGIDEPVLTEDNPIAGQISGGLYWHNQPHLGLDGGMSASEVAIILDSTKNMGIDTAQGAINSGLDYGQGVVGGIVDRVQSGGNGIIDHVQGYQNNPIVDTIIDYGQGLGNQGVDGIQNQASDAFDRVQGYVDGKVDDVQQFTSDKIHQYGPAIDYAAETSVELIKEGGDLLNDVLSWF